MDGDGDGRKYLQYTNNTRINVQLLGCPSDGALQLYEKISQQTFN